MGAAIDSPEEQAEPQTETTGPPPLQLHESRASVEQGPELQTVLALQQRLSKVFGVATVILEVSVDLGYRSLVEMAAVLLSPGPSSRAPSRHSVTTFYAKLHLPEPMDGASMLDARRLAGLR